MEMSYLIELHKRKEVNQLSGFLDYMKNMDVNRICEGYRQLRDVDAPQRVSPYFQETHNGISSSGASSTRREEHLALFNASRGNKIFKLPDGRLIDFVDYQTPLKAKQMDEGVGNIDLFGVIDKELPTVIELKIENLDGGRADTPLRALLEGLAYCSIVERNISKIIDEAAVDFDIQLSGNQPTLVVLAPEEYWERYLQNTRAGNWIPELIEICNQFKDELNVEIILLAMTDSEFEMGLDSVPARLTGNCELVIVESMA